MGSGDDDQFHYNVTQVVPSQPAQKHHKGLSLNNKILLVVAVTLFALILLFLMLLCCCRIYQRRRRERGGENTAEQPLADQLQSSHSVPVDHVVAPIEVHAVPNSGLDPWVVASLPKFKYKKLEKQGKGERAECSVCLGNLVDEATVRVLPNCCHVFHVECVDQWLSSNTTCPICRAAVEPTEEPAVAQPNQYSPPPPPLGIEVQPTAPPLEDAPPHDANEQDKMGRNFHV